MPERFVYHQRVKNSVWPTLFKILGRTFFNAPKTLPEKWRIDQFEQYLMVGDEQADLAARDLFMSDRKHAQSFRSMNKVLEHGLDAETDIPDYFRQLIESVCWTGTKWNLARGYAAGWGDMP